MCISYFYLQVVPHRLVVRCILGPPLFALLNMKKQQVISVQESDCEEWIVPLSMTHPFFSSMEISVLCRYHT